MEDFYKMFVMIFILIFGMMFAVVGGAIIINMNTQKTVEITILSIEEVKPVLMPRYTTLFGINSKIDVFSDYDFMIGKTYVLKLQGTIWLSTFNVLDIKETG